MPFCEYGKVKFSTLSFSAANTGLGIGVGCSGRRGTSNYGIFVHHIADGSVAQKDGRLRYPYIKYYFHLLFLCYSLYFNKPNGILYLVYVTGYVILFRLMHLSSC